MTSSERLSYIAASSICLRYARGSFPLHHSTRMLTLGIRADGGDDAHGLQFEECAHRNMRATGSGLDQRESRSLATIAQEPPTPPAFLEVDQI